ncbi:Hypothetical predicted protein [Paramuricea clavata]|uniref:Mutator-like transposase domain-containing protein n=1 Tax=Paramuricea clavata TaxID=317549 RepID=A0A6S7KEU0_PARCT|nr:Hypothetical predicted protein [Paramuricea clavata]
MPKPSKKRRFRGQRWDSSVPVSNSSNSNLSSPCASTPAIETASMRKITSQNTERSEDVDGAYSYRLIELSNLVSAFQPLHECEFGGELKVGDDEARSSDETDVAEIAVSYDGTWSKRGYTANFGVGFVISVETGEVLDFDFESKLCKECETTKRDLGEDSCEFDIWYGGHKDQCTQTHTGSSGSMECSIAKKIWDRSKDRNLQYKFMTCDGDSKAYGSI